MSGCLTPQQTLRQEAVPSVQKANRRFVNYWGTFSNAGRDPAKLPDAFETSER